MSIRHVKRGDAFQLKAADFNLIADSANAHQARMFSKDRHGARLGGATVLIENDSGADVDRFGVLAISDVLVSPTDNLVEFQQAPALQGITPVTGYEGRFAVAADPIADEAIGYGFVAGTCCVQISVTDADCYYAEILNSDAAKLGTHPAGTAQILWKESGTGTKWAVVLLGGGANRPVLAKTQEAAQADEYISVKFMNGAGTDVFGSAFDAKCLFVDGETAANHAKPLVASGVPVVIQKLSGTWYITNPSFTSVGSDC